MLRKILFLQRNKLATALKVATNILVTNINERIILREKCQGFSLRFRCRRSCMDLVVILRCIKEKFLEYTKPLNMCLIHLKQEFDRVRNENVIYLLHDSGIHLKLTKSNRKYI